MISHRLRRRPSGAPPVPHEAPPASGEAGATAETGTPRTTRSRVRRLAGFAFDALLVAALALTVFIGYGMIGNRWYHVVAIEGGSMEPTITRGDLIVVTPAPSKIEPGMILTMGVGGRMVTHRVIEVKPDGSLVTKGDANNVVDDWAGRPITVYGEYLFTIPMIGRYLPISNAVHSGATFREGISSEMTLTVASLPTPSPTPEPQATPDPTPPPTPEPTPACDPDASPTPDATAVSTIPPCDPEPTANPTPDPTASPAPDPTEVPSPSPDATPEPRRTPGPEGTPVPAPDPTTSREPGPDATPAPGDAAPGPSGPPAAPSPAPAPGPAPSPSPTPAP